MSNWEFGSGVKAARYGRLHLQQFDDLFHRAMESKEWQTAGYVRWRLYPKHIICSSTCWRIRDHAQRHLFVIQIAFFPNQALLKGFLLAFVAFSAMTYCVLVPLPVTGLVVREGPIIFRWSGGLFFEKCKLFFRGF